MKKLITTITLLMLCLSWATAQTLTPKKDEKKGKWGYVNTSGKWVVKPKFDMAEPFVEYPGGVMCGTVVENGLKGILNSSGKHILGTLYKNIEVIKNSNEVQDPTELYKLIDMQRQLMEAGKIPNEEFFRMKEFLERDIEKQKNLPRFLFKVTDANGKIGLASPNGAPGVPCKFDKITEVEDNVLFCENDVPDYNEPRIPTHSSGNPDAMLWDVLNGAPVALKKESSHKIIAGGFKVDPILTVTEYRDERGKKVLITSDTFGHVLPPDFEYYDYGVQSFQKAGHDDKQDVLIYHFRRNRNYGKEIKYIDVTSDGDIPQMKDGKIVPSDQWASLVSGGRIFFDGEAYDLTSGKMQKADVKNIKLINNIYSFSKSAANGKYVGGVNDLERLTTTVHEFEDIKSNLDLDIPWAFIAKEKGKWGIYDANCYSTIEVDEDTQLHRMDAQHASYTKGDKKGLLYCRAKGYERSDYYVYELLPAEYDEITPLVGPFWKVKKDGQWKLIYAASNNINPEYTSEFYDDIELLPLSGSHAHNTVLTKRDGKCGLLLIGYNEYSEEWYRDMEEGVAPIYDSLKWNEGAMLFDAVKNGKPMYVSRLGKEYDGSPVAEVYVGRTHVFSKKYRVNEARMDKINMGAEIYLYFLKDKECTIKVELLRNGVPAGKAYTFTKVVKPYRDYAEESIKDVLDIWDLNILVPQYGSVVEFSKLKLGVRVTVTDSNGKVVGRKTSNLKYSDKR